MMDFKTDSKALYHRLKGINIQSSLISQKINEAYLMLSLECNLRCRVCAWWGVKGPCRKKNFLEKYKPGLSLKDLKRFADELVFYRPQIISFSGGEPLIYKKWLPLARYFKSKGIKLALVTNGFLINRDFEKIVSVVDQIALSLEGSPDIEGFIKKKNKEFREVIKGLKKLTEWKLKNNNMPALRILYTISDKTYLYMSEMVRFLKNENILVDLFRFQHLMFINRTTFNRQKAVFKDQFGIRNLDIWKGFTHQPSKIDFQVFNREIKELRALDDIHQKATGKSHISFSPDLSPQDLKKFYENNSQAPGYASFCTAPWHQLNLLPNGDIYICPDYVIGNIKNTALKEIWNGSDAKKLREYTLKSLFPSCKGCFFHYTDRMR